MSAAIIALSEALAGCVEHMEWSTPQGRKAFESAIAALALAESALIADRDAARAQLRALQS